jgi:Zn-dependent oligopeptidase
MWLSNAKYHYDSENWIAGLFQITSSVFGMSVKDNLRLNRKDVRQAKVEGMFSAAGYANGLTKRPILM